MGRPEGETLYDRIGGLDTLNRLTAAFYARIESDPALRPMFPRNLKVPRERQALFLAEEFGGPALYSKRRGGRSLPESHAAFPIGREEVEAWLRHMEAAMEDAGIRGRERTAMHCYFVDAAATLSDPLGELYLSPLDSLAARLTSEPDMVHTRNLRGNTLLHAAAGTWDVARVRLLLRHGAVADGRALYVAANQLVSPEFRMSDSGRVVVAVLVQHGADVDSRGGVGHMTPLHMAARRGNVAVAEALLDAGAELEAKDTKGETPLRRAVNCGHTKVVNLFLARGADPISRDKKNRTPLEAARDPAIRRLLAGAGAST